MCFPDVPEANKVLFSAAATTAGRQRGGQSLAEVLALVRARPNSFRLAEVKYASPQQGTAAQQPSDIAICFPEHGFHLLFDGCQQRLRLVEVHDPTRLQVRFGGRLFGGAAQTPTFGLICEAFGPTYPGEALDGHYPLQYPGFLFLFPLHSRSQQEQQLHILRHQRLGSGSDGDLPVPLSTPAARIIVHHGSAASLAAAQAAAPPPLPHGSTYFEVVEAVPGQGLLFGGGGQLLRFGDSPQDVVSELGEPSSTHTKHACPASPVPTAPGNLLAGAAGAGPDYLYCYTQRGLDVLFCGATHRLKKLVLHANLPGHPDFGLYSKCNFRVHPMGSWNLPGSGGDEADDLPHYTASAGSEGGASMKTAASDASLAATESAVQQGHNSSGAALAADELAELAPDSTQQEQQQRAAKASSGLTAAYNMLVGLIDDVIHIDGEALDGCGGSGGAAGMPGKVAASPQEEAAAAEDAVPALMQPDGGSSSAAWPVGRPPRPPTSHPIPAPLSSGGKSRKKKTKEKQRPVAAAAARLLGAAAGGDEQAGSEDADTDADAPFADSAPSSLASSPGMTSFMAYIAATGGAGIPAPAVAAAAAAAPSGYSNEGSATDLAGKERQLQNGSAFDGWSEANDLALLADEVPPAGARDAAAAAAQQSSVEERRAPQQPPQLQGRLRVSTAVQTAADADLVLTHSSGDAAPSPDSPDSFVITDSPELFDETAAAAEYESVPRQCSSGTQTSAHMLAGPLLRPVSAAATQLRRGVACGSSALAVSVDGCLADIQAGFGRGAKPALHTWLGGRHPFGPTHLYAYRGAVFEVLHSGCIATVTLFEA